MNKKLENIFEKIIRSSFYLFVFFLPWQIKYIIIEAPTNYTEISLYLSQILLVLTVLFFVFYKLRNCKYCDNVPFIWLALTGFTFFIFTSFFFAVNKEVSYYKFLIILFSLGIFYLLRENRRLRIYEREIISETKIIIIFLSSIFLHSILAIYQFLSQKSFAFKYLGLAEHSSEILGTSVVESISGRWLRAYGGFDHPNILGGVLAFSLILALYYLVRKKIITRKSEMIQSMFLFVFYFTGLLALIFSFSRSAWLSFIISLILLFVIFLFKKNYSAFKRLIILFLFSFILTFIIFIPFKDLFTGRVQATGRLEQKSLTERQEQINESANIISNNWLFGVGFGNYTTILKNKDITKKADWNYQPVHNSFLLLISETGIFSLLFFVFLLISLFKDKRKAEYYWPLISILIVIFLFDHWMISLPFGNLFLFFILGLL